MTRFRSHAVRAGILLIAGLGASELLLRAGSAVSPTLNAELGGLPAWQIADPILGHRLRPRSGEADERGYRNRAAVATAAIVALGDSMTFCHSTSIDQAWPERVQALTGLSTYNMGVGGYGPAHYVVLVHEALALAPKVVLVALYSGNDVADAYTMVYERGRLPELRTTDPGRLAEVEEAARTRPPIDASWLETRRRLDLATPSVDPGIRLFALFRSIWTRLQPSGVPRTWPDWRRLADHSDPNVAFAFELGRVRTVLTARDHMALLDPGDPRVLAGEDVTSLALKRIHDELPSGTRLGIVLIPTKELVFYELVAGHANVPPALGGLVREETAFWDRIRLEGANLGADVIDVLPALRGILAKGVNPYQESSDAHPAAAGYEAIAEAVASSRLISALRPDPEAR